jgi:hypothetical protein
LQAAQHKPMIFRENREKSKESDSGARKVAA